MKASDVGGAVPMSDWLGDLVKENLGLAKRPALVMAVTDSPAATVWSMTPGRITRIVDVTMGSVSAPEKVRPEANELMHSHYPDGTLAICIIRGGVPVWF